MIVIGDVHGCFKTLMALVKKLPDKKLVFTGDLIDRGKQSKKVVDFVIKNEHYSVMGNHEDMMTDLLSHKLWMYNGGIETLKSYEDANGSYVNELAEHIKWMEQLPLIIEYNNFIISHSAAFCSWNIEHDSDEFINDVLWGRDFMLVRDNKLPERKINIFGHTPVEKVLKEKHFILLDGGCVFKRNNYNKLGTLFAYDMDEDIFYEQENIED